MIPNGINLTDDSSRSHTKSFLKSPLTCSRNDFFNRNSTFFNRPTLVFYQLNNRTARYTGKDAICQRWCQECAINQQHQVHRSAFFDVLVFFVIRPDYLVIPFFNSLCRWIKSPPIISSSFCVSNTTACCASILLLNFHLYTSAVVRTYRTSDNTEGIIIALTCGNKF